MGNSPSSSPAATRAAAATTASATGCGRTPSSALARAAAPLTRPSAEISAGSMGAR